MQSYRVLIADDERPVRQLLERICSQLGWESDAVEDGKQAVERMKTNQYQIFTVDVNMPGPSGVELARIILKQYETPAILILTGYAEVKDAVLATKEGVYNYIQKDNVEVADIKTHLLMAAQYYENLRSSTEANKQREKDIQSLEISQKQFQALIDLSSDMVFIVEVDDLMVKDCNPAACHQLEYVREELLNHSILELVPDFTSSYLQDQFLHHSNQLNLFETKISTKNGRSIDVEIALTFICLHQGVFLGIVIRDITERKALQAEILQERNLLHLLMDNIPDSIYFKDKELKLIRVNQAFVQYMGLRTAQDTLQKTVYDFYSKPQADQLFHQEQEIMRTQKPLVNHKNELMLPDGSKQWFSTTEVPIFDAGGNVDGLIGISRNITEEKETEAKIRQSTQRLEVQAAELDAILEGIEEGVLSTGLSCNIIQVSSWFEQLIGIPKEFLIGENINSVLNQYCSIDVGSTLSMLQSMETAEKQIQKFTVQETEYVLTLKSIIVQNTFMGVLCCIQNLSELNVESELNLNQDSILNHSFVLEDYATPINGMLEVVNQLAETKLSSDQKELVETLALFGHSIKNLITASQTET